MLTQALPNLEAWVAHFKDAEIPVFRETVAALERLHEREDEISAGDLAPVVQADPLMTLKVLAFAGRFRSRRVVTDSETVVSSLVLMGVSPFFRAFGNLTAVEDLLAARPEALAGLHDDVARAFRAAAFALEIAVMRVDTDAEVLQEAAMLHDFAEMLLWCHAPDLACEIRLRQIEHPLARRATVQRAVLGVDLGSVQRVLMEEWRMPDLLAMSRDRTKGYTTGVRNVLVAVELARHSQHGWDNPALDEDIVAMAGLLKVSPERARALALEIDR